MVPPGSDHCSEDQGKQHARLNKGSGIGLLFMSFGFADWPIPRAGFSYHQRWSTSRPVRAAGLSGDHSTTVSWGMAMTNWPSHSLMNDICSMISALRFQGMIIT